MIRLLSLAVATAAVFAGPNLAPAAEAKPNILFIIADDASPSFGCYGTKWAKTPNIDRLAANGITFMNSYVPTAKCAPCRAAILTGRYPWLLEEAANHQNFFPAKFKAFSEALAEAGVACGSAGKVWGPGSATTTDGKTRTWGMTHAGPRKKGAKDAAGPGAAFKQFLANKPADKPFFYWFGSTNPHRPYKADAGLDAGKKPADIDRVPAFWPDNDTIRRDMLDYATEIEDYDAEVGSLIKTLDESGQAANTLVIVTSDHGMPFPRSKGHNYDISNRVPLIACWPKGIVKPGRKVEAFTNHVDFAPTFLELGGIDGKKAGLEPHSGVSFVDLLSDKPAHDRPHCLTGRERNDVYARPGSETGLGYPIRAIREGNFLYIHNFAPDRWPCGNPELGFLDTDASPAKKFAEDAGEKSPWWQFAFGKRPQEELFDLSKDPDCVKNLAAEDTSRAHEMKAKLFTLLKAQGDPRILGKGDAFDNYPTVKPKK